jgi:hypothetical protein
MRRSAVLLLVTSPLWAQLPAGAVHGIVKDAATGEPLSDFRITARAIISKPASRANTAVMTSYQSGSNPRQRTIDLNTGNIISDIEIAPETTAITGSDGKYTLAKVPSGKLTITARNARRESVTRELSLDPGDELAVDFLVPPNPMAAGRVLDPDKKPASGIKVWAVQASSVDGSAHYSLFGPRVTDDNGAFLFDWGLSSGKAFYLIADQPRPAETEPEKPIEAPTYYGNATALDAATPIVLERGENRGSLDIQLRRSAHYCVTGTLAVSGKPARNPFEIREFALAETSLARATGASDDRGKYRVCGLTPGQYRVIANGPNHEADTEDFIVADADVAHVDLALDAVPLHLTVEWVSDPVIAPPVSESVATRLESAGFKAPLNARLQNVQISLDGRGGGRENRIATVNVPYDGLFESRLAVGDYRVTVRPPACCYSKELDYGGIPLSGPLHLAAGSSGTLRVLIGTDGATLKCRATDDDGKPVEEAAIVLVADAPGSEPQLQWNVLAPGKYKVIAVNRNITLPEDRERIRSALGNAQSVELSPNAKLELKLKVVSID